MGDAADDDFDRGLRELEEGEVFEEGGPVRCKRCGQGPFTWLHTGVRWRLVDDNNRFHECLGITPDDFDHG